MTLSRISLIFILTFSLASCSKKHEGTLRNESIQPVVKNEITKLNSAVIDALKKKDQKKLTDLMTADLRASVNETLTRFLEQTS